MSSVTGQRITFKRTRPNPLFQDWLEELYEEAKLKKNVLENSIKEALSSLAKYPLPLESGTECAILKGFDKRLCLYLKQRLELHNESIKTLSLNGDRLLASKNSTNITVPATVFTNTEQPAQIQSNSPNSVKISKSRYKPEFRSGGYAILMTLLDQAKNNNNSLLQKAELIELAQKYCNESFTRVKPGTRYNAWANMGRLIKKGLVNKKGSRKTQYSLTELGMSVANALLLETEKRPSVNDIIFRDTSLNNEITQNSDINIRQNDEYPYKLDNFIQNVETHNKESQINTLHVDDEQLIIMEAQSFEIILIIDKNETSGLSKKNDPTVAQFNKYPDLKHEYRSLKVGDFTWIARHKTTNQELVLPYIVERKRMDDLGASIKDGRFHEQKFRLRKCGLPNVIYMLEHYGNNKHVGLPVPTLMQALANTRIQDRFKVHVTESHTHSARFLAIMTLRLTFEFKGKTLKGHNKEANNNILMTYEYFNKSSVKNKPLSVTDTFIKLLLQLKGVSVQKALAITNEYKTPASLIKAYKNCSQKEGEMLLSNLRCREVNVGPSVSKTVYQLFTLKYFN